MNDPAPSTTHFKRPARHQCTDFDALFAQGDYGALLNALKPHMAKAIGKYSGLTAEDREDALSEAVTHLYNEFTAGKRYGQWPIRAVACNRASYVVKDMFAHAAKPKAYGITVVPLDYAYPDMLDGSGPQTIDVPDRSVDLTDEYLQSEVAAVALRGLSSREREIAIKRCLEAKSAEQIGSELRCTANAVDQAFFRAKKKMKTNLESYLGDDDFGVPAI